MMQALILSVLLTAAPLAFATDYGAPITGDLDPAPIAEVLADPESLEGREVTVSGRITRVCQKTGCWVMLTDGEASLRVTTEHAFFVPKDSTGRAIAIGTLTGRTLETDQAPRHAAPNTQPLEAGAREWRLVARSIRITSAAE